MIRLQDMIVTTTPSIDGREILAYLGTISSHVVAGTNVFSDIFAGLSDFFGGRSESYQKQITSIHNEAIDILKNKASLLGGNCIVGLRIDHDEISGKGKSMFMVTAVGTAVRAQELQLKQKTSYKKENIVDSNELENLLRRKEIIDSSKKGKLYLDDETWSFVIENKVFEISTTILNELQRIHSLVPDSLDDRQRKFVEMSEEYFLSLPEDKSKQILYGSILDGVNIFTFVKDIVEQANLLDFEFINKLLESDDFEIQKMTLSLLECEKTIYSRNDIEQFLKLSNKIESIFVVRAKHIEEKGKLLKRMKKKWICECGKKNDVETKYCYSCKNSIYGFSLEEVQPSYISNLLKNKASVLKERFAEE